MYVGVQPANATTTSGTSAVRSHPLLRTRRRTGETASLRRCCRRIAPSPALKRVGGISEVTNHCGFMYRVLPHSRHLGRKECLTASVHCPELGRFSTPSCRVHTHIMILIFVLPMRVMAAARWAQCHHQPPAYRASHRGLPGAQMKDEVAVKKTRIDPRCFKQGAAFGGAPGRRSARNARATTA